MAPGFFIYGPKLFSNFIHGHRLGHQLFALDHSCQLCSYWFFLVYLCSMWYGWWNEHNNYSVISLCNFRINWNRIKLILFKRCSLRLDMHFKRTCSIWETILFTFRLLVIGVPEFPRSYPALINRNRKSWNSFRFRLTRSAIPDSFRGPAGYSGSGCTLLWEP